MRDIKIKKALLTGRSMKITYSRRVMKDVGDITDEVTIKCGALVHDDLLRAMDRLKVHLALICDFKETAGLPEVLDLDTFDASELLAGVYVGGKINRIWKVFIPDITNRQKAYRWLAGQLGITVDECHVGMFNEFQCELVIEVCKNALKEYHKKYGNDNRER